MNAPLRSSAFFHRIKLRFRDSIGNAIMNRTYRRPTAEQNVGPLRLTVGIASSSASRGGGTYSVGRRVSDRRYFRRDLGGRASTSSNGLLLGFFERRRVREPPIAEYTRPRRCDSELFWRASVSSESGFRRVERASDPDRDPSLLRDASSSRSSSVAGGVGEGDPSSSDPGSFSRESPPSFPAFNVPGFPAFSPADIEKRVLPSTTRTSMPTLAFSTSRSISLSTRRTTSGSTRSAYAFEAASVSSSSSPAGRPGAFSESARGGGAALDVFTCGRPLVALAARSIAILRRRTARCTSGAAKSWTMSKISFLRVSRAASSGPSASGSSSASSSRSNSSTTSGGFAWCRLLNMNCISWTSMHQVQTSATAWKPMRVARSPSMNLFRSLRFARRSRVWNAAASAIIDANIPNTTAKTFHVFIRSSRLTLASSATEIGRTRGGDADAVKSVAWSHKHATRDAVSHPHPSNACASLRQRHRAAFSALSIRHSTLDPFAVAYPRMRVVPSAETKSVNSSHPTRSVGWSNVHRNDAFADASAADPARASGRHASEPPGGNGFGSVAHPSELYAAAASSQNAHVAAGRVALESESSTESASLARRKSDSAHVAPNPTASTSRIGISNAIGRVRLCTASDAPATSNVRASVPATLGADATSPGAAVTFVASSACASNASAKRSRSTGAPAPSSSASRGTSNAAPPAALRAALGRLSGSERDATKAILVAFPDAGRSPGSADATAALASALADAVADASAVFALASDAAALRVDAESAESMLLVAVSERAADKSPSASLATASSISATAATPANRAALDASHGSSSTRDTTSATEPKSVTELGTAADALEVTLSIASRSAARVAAAPVGSTPPPPRHREAADSNSSAGNASRSDRDEVNSDRRFFAAAVTFALNAASWRHAPATWLIAASAPPLRSASSAARTAELVASVAAASVAMEGHVTVTLVSTTSDVAPSASRACAPTVTTFSCVADPPGKTPTYSARGLKSWSC